MSNTTLCSIQALAYGILKNDIGVNIIPKLQMRRQPPRGQAAQAARMVTKGGEGLEKQSLSYGKIHVGGSLRYYFLKVRSYNEVVTR